MIDAIRIDFTQEVQTILAPATATARRHYHIAGFCLETLLSEEERFKADAKKAISHILSHRASDPGRREELMIYTSTNDLIADNKPLLKITRDIGGVLIYVDFTIDPGKREPQEVTRQEALTICTQAYHRALLDANDPLCPV